MFILFSLIYYIFTHYKKNGAYDCFFRYYFFFQIHKVDVDSKDILTWKEAGMFVSEPIFVPRPHCKSEDDGILCVTLLGNTFYLPILAVCLLFGILSLFIFRRNLTK